MQVCRQMDARDIFAHFNDQPVQAVQQSPYRRTNSRLVVVNSSVLFRPCTAPKSYSTGPLPWLDSSAQRRPGWFGMVPNPTSEATTPGETKRRNKRTTPPPLSPCELASLLPMVGFGPVVLEPTAAMLQSHRQDPSIPPLPLDQKARHQAPLLLSIINLG